MKVEKRLEMGRKELDRVRVISAVCEGHRSQRQAALELELSVRQVQRLVQRYRGQGAKGLISDHAELEVKCLVRAVLGFGRRTPRT